MACFVNSLQNYGLFLICANIFARKMHFLQDCYKKKAVYGDIIAGQETIEGRWNVYSSYRRRKEKYGRIFAYLVEKSIYQREFEITKNYKIKRTKSFYGARCATIWETNTRKIKPKIDKQVYRGTITQISIINPKTALCFISNLRYISTV